MSSSTALRPPDETGKKEVVFQPSKLYLYLSADGITRQRCGRHVHHEPWGRPVRIWLVQQPSKRHTCIECYYESQEKE